MVNIVIDEYIRKQILIATCLYLGHIAVGGAIGWSSPVVIKLKDPALTPLQDKITDELSSWVGSTFHLGVIVGPHISGPLSNVLGRKRCMIIGGVSNILAQLIMAFSVNLPMIFAGRALAGMGLGIISVVNIVYIGEIASPNIRGILLTGSGVFHTLGTLIVYAVGPYLSYAGVGYVATGIAVVHVLAVFTIPESPIFYILKGKKEETKDILRILGRGKDVEKELESISEDVKGYKEKKSDWKELFTIKSNRKSLIIAVAMFILQQFSGMLAATYFTQTIFESANVKSIKSSLSAIIVGVTQFVGTIIVPFLIERSGRKTLTLVSLAGCCAGMVVLGTYFYLSKVNYEAVVNVGWLPLAALMLSFFSFSIGLNITPNTFTCEMFRPNVRSVGSSIALTVGIFTGFISITTFGYLITAIGQHYTFWMFAIINAVGFVFTLFVVPETKGMTLVEIEKMLSK